ncbi:MAG: hypothetical protein ACLTYY_03750 [Faecalibacterium prausnitzii]
MISTAIQQLVNYGLDTGLILPDDEIYIRNQLLMTMQLDDFTAPDSEVCYTDLESILKTLVDDAVARGVCEDNSTARDLFDTKLMGVLTPRPSIVRANFEERYENEGPQAATDWFYKFSQDTDYIRRYRIKRDLKWVTAPLRRSGYHHQPLETRKTMPLANCSLVRLPSAIGTGTGYAGAWPPCPRESPHYPPTIIDGATAQLHVSTTRLHRFQNQHTP